METHCTLDMKTTDTARSSGVNRMHSHRKKRNHDDGEIRTHAPKDQCLKLAPYCGTVDHSATSPVCVISTCEKITIF